MKYLLKVKCDADEEEKRFEALEAKLNSKDYLKLRERKYSQWRALLIYDLLKYPYNLGEVRGKLEIKIPRVFRSDYISEFVTTLKTERYYSHDSELMQIIGWIVEGQDDHRRFEGQKTEKCD